MRVDDTLEYRLRTSHGLSLSLSSSVRPYLLRRLQYPFVAEGTAYALTSHHIIYNHSNDPRHKWDEQCSPVQ